MTKNTNDYSAIYKFLFIAKSIIFFLSASSNVDLKNPFIEQKSHTAQIYLYYFFKDRADCNSARNLCED